MELLGQSRGFMRLCIIYKLIQFGLRILRCCLAGGLHIIQTAQDITDPVSGVLHLCFRMLDAPALSPLPLAPYEYTEYKAVKVGPDYHVEYARHWYSEIGRASCRERV